MRAVAADEAPAEAAASAPLFAFARCTRAAGGGFTTDDSGDSFRLLLGCGLAEHLASPGGADLAVALNSVLLRVESDKFDTDVEFGLVDPSGYDRRIRARLHGSWEGDAAVAIVVMDEARPQDAAAGTSGTPSPPAVVIRLERNADGRLYLHFVDSAISHLTGTPLARLADTPAAAIILSRGEAVMASATCPIGSTLCELTIRDPAWGGRPLVCRFFRDGGRGGLVMHDPTPSAAALMQARRIDALLRLLRLSEVLLEHPPQHEGLERIANEIVGAPGSRRVVIGLVDRGRRLQVGADVGRTLSDQASELTLSLVGGACGEAIRSRQMAMETTVAGRDLCIYAPIEAGDGTLGVLAMAIDPDLEIDGWQEEVIGSYADYIAAFVVGAPARPRALQRANQREPDTIDIQQRLTTRQCDVLYLLTATGASNREIARELSTTEATIKVHMRAILSGLRVSSRTEAINAVYSRAAGWLAEMRRRHPLK